VLALSGAGVLPLLPVATSGDGAEGLKKQFLKVGGRAGLSGPHRIIQKNPNQPVLEIEDTVAAEICNLALTRPEVYGGLQRSCPRGRVGGGCSFRGHSEQLL